MGSEGERLIDTLTEKGIKHLEQMEEADHRITISDLEGFIRLQVKGNPSKSLESIRGATERAWKGTTKGKRKLRFLSLFSGIEAASVAWKPLGWECVGVSEIDPYGCQVIRQRLPEVPNLGDITQIKKEDLDGLGTIDVIVGGSPCQSFSVTGHRKGLQDHRGSLMFHYIRIIKIVSPRWFIWENVQGALSSEKGRAFGTLIGALDECGYAMGWRVLDAKNFGVPQSRKRVFLVGTTTGPHKTYSVLFGSNVSRWNASEDTRQEQGRPDTPPSSGDSQRERSAFCMVINGSGHPRRQGGSGDCACCLLATRGNTMRNWIIHLSEGDHEDARVDCVRRLSSVEMERIQGFPDDWTDIEWRGKGSKDIRRQFSLGNSMAVPVVRWLGEGIQTAICGRG